MKSEQDRTNYLHDHDPPGICIAGNHMTKGSIRVYEECGETIFLVDSEHKGQHGETVVITDKLVEEIKNHVINRKGILYSFHFIDSL